MAFLVHKLMLNKAGSLEFDNIRDVTSPWCGKSPPSTPPIESIVNWVVRHYITVVWDNYDPDKPIKLIFAFHGRTNSNTQVREYYDIEEESDGNAIIVYPSWLPEETSPRSRSNPWDKSSRLRDFALFDQILKEFNNNYCINQDEIFVVGHSLWAWFTNSLACARWDVIRGIWSVWWGTTINDCAWPVSAIIMHNPIDNLAPFKSWEIARDQLLKQNQCESVKKSVWPDGLQCVEYSCLDNATTIWCPYTNSVNYNGKFYPHMRPDSAGSYIYDFLDLQE
jgi:polyhydroxybutyrate depolymerase